MKSSVKAPSHLSRRQKAPKTPKAAPVTPAHTFASLWQKVQKAKASLENLTLKQQVIMQQYHEQILPQETLYLNAMYDEIEHLMTFAFKPALSERDREWLQGYIEAALKNLTGFPFPLAKDPKILFQKWLDALKAYFDVQEYDEMANLFNELLAELSGLAGVQEPRAQEDQQDAPQEDSNPFDADFFYQQQAPIQPPEAPENLFNSGLLNKVFRHLAKRLHPDLATCEQEKAHKHELMTQLLQARDQQDLATLLDLHSRYGEPEALALEDEHYGALITLLKKQLKELNYSKDDLQYDGLAAVLYRRFYRRGAVAQKAVWSNEVQLLMRQEWASRLRVKQIKSVSALKKQLSEMRMWM